MNVKDKVIAALAEHVGRVQRGEVYGGFMPSDELVAEGAYGIVAQVVMEYANAQEWGVVTDLLFKEIPSRDPLDFPPGYEMVEDTYEFPEEKDTRTLLRELIAVLGKALDEGAL